MAIQPFSAFRHIRKKAPPGTPYKGAPGSGFTFIVQFQAPGYGVTMYYQRKASEKLGDEGGGKAFESALKDFLEGDLDYKTRHLKFFPLVTEVRFQSLPLALCMAQVDNCVRVRVRVCMHGLVYSAGLRARGSYGRWLGASRQLLRKRLTRPSTRGTTTSKSTWTSRPRRLRKIFCESSSRTPKRSRSTWLGDLREKKLSTFRSPYTCACVRVLSCPLLLCDDDSHVHMLCIGRPGASSVFQGLHMSTLVPCPCSIVR